MYSIKLCKCIIGRKNLKAEIGTKTFIYFVSFYHKHVNGDIESLSIDTPDLIHSLTLLNCVEFKTKAANVHKREI
jgi:hypothetical protein